MGPWAEQLEFVKWSKIEALFSPGASRTKLMAGAELCWSKEIRGLLMRSEKTPQLHMHRKPPQGSKTRTCHPIISVVKPPTGLCAGIHLGKKAAYTYWAAGGGRWKGGSQNRAGVGKEMKSLAKGKQRSSRTALYIWFNGLFTAFFLTGEGAYTPSLGVVFLPCFSLKQTPMFLCVLYCCTVSLIISFVPVFTVFASLRNSYFKYSKREGNFISSLLPPVD